MLYCQPMSMGRGRVGLGAVSAPYLLRVLCAPWPLRTSALTTESTLLGAQGCGPAYASTLADTHMRNNTNLSLARVHDKVPRCRSIMAASRFLAQLATLRPTVRMEQEPTGSKEHHAQAGHDVAPH